MTEQYLKDLESFTGISHTKISLADEWARTCPDEYQGVTLEQFMSTVCSLSLKTTSTLF